MRNPNLREMIDMFLEERRESLGGGWAEITEHDVGMLYRIVWELLSLKCDKDADGDYPIQVKLVNRRIFEADHFSSVPYDREESFLRRLEIMMRNLNCAHTRLDTAVRCQRLDEEYDA